MAASIETDWSWARSASPVVASGTTIPAGQVVLVTVTIRSTGATVSVTDNTGSHTYTEIQDPEGAYSRVFYCATEADVTSITATTTDSSEVMLGVWSLDGVDTANPINTYSTSNTQVALNFGPVNVTPDAPAAVFGVMGLVVSNRTTQQNNSDYIDQGIYLAGQMTTNLVSFLNAPAGVATGPDWTITSGSATGASLLTVAFNVAGAVIDPGVDLSMAGASGWSSVTGGGTRLEAISDTDDTSYISTRENPSSEVLQLTLPAIEPPAGDLVVTLRASTSAGTSTVVPELYLPSTDSWVAAASELTVAGAVSDYQAMWSAASLSSLTTEQWAAGAVVRLSAQTDAHLRPIFRQVASSSLQSVKLGVVTATGLDVGYGDNWRSVHVRLHQATVAATAEDSTPPEETEDFPVPEFLIGVDSQPENSFSKWQGRGINTLVRIPSGGHDQDTWTTAAQAAGLYQIRSPRAGSVDDGDVPGLIAWSLRDEPDLKGDASSLTISQGNALRARNSSRPVFLNYAGGVVLDHQGNVPSDYYQTTEAAGDWICNDFYPVAGWNHPDWIPEVGEAVDTLRDISPTKPMFAYIECSDQNQPNLAHRAATPGEMRAQIWLAVIAGVNGIVYFPIRLGYQTESFSFDGVVAAGLESEMIAQNTILSDLSPVLISERNPAGLTAAASNSGLQVGWRQVGEVNYVIVLNTTDTAISNANITLSGFGTAESAVVYGESRDVTITGGSMTDSFTAYQKHVYIIEESDGGGGGTGEGYDADLGTLGNRPALATRPDETNTGPRQATTQTMSAAEAINYLNDEAPLESDGMRYLRGASIGGTIRWTYMNYRNVVFEDCIISGGSYPVDTSDVASLPGSELPEFRYCEIVGGSSASVLANYVRLLRCNIHNGTDIIKISGSGTEIYACYLHDTYHGIDAHCDIIQIRNGATNVLLHWNNMLGFNSADSPQGALGTSNGVLQTGSVIGNIGPVEWRNNWFDGGHYTIRGANPAEYTVSYLFRDNRFGRNFMYGPLTSMGGSNIDFDSSNVWDDTGLPV